MFLQQSTGKPAITMTPEHPKPEPADLQGNETDNPAARQEKNLAAGTDIQIPMQDPPRQKRGRPRTRRPHAAKAKRPQNAAGTQAETTMPADTDEIISNLQRQGVLKPPAPSLPGGGPGHRTKNCRPVQINVSETMFRQLKMIAATQSISIKDQIIAALVRQGYKS